MVVKELECISAAAAQNVVGGPPQGPPSPPALPFATLTQLMHAWPTHGVSPRYKRDFPVSMSDLVFSIELSESSWKGNYDRTLWSWAGRLQYINGTLTFPSLPEDSRLDVLGECIPLASCVHHRRLPRNCEDFSVAIWATSKTGRTLKLVRSILRLTVSTSMVVAQYFRSNTITA
jgi:hypothetical protein